jgi:hypothetical protein
MGNRDDRNVPSHPNEYDVIWKVVDGEASHVWIGDARDERSSVRKLLKVLKRLSHLRCEAFGDFCIPLLVPGNRFLQFTTRSFA